MFTASGSQECCDRSETRFGRGDHVRLEMAGNQQAWIVRIEPRRSTLSRTSKQRRHIIAANVDQLLIVTSAAQPTIKPNLIDRLLATAEAKWFGCCHMYQQVRFN